MRINHLVLGMAVLALTGCLDSVGGTAKIDQSTVCNYSSDEAARACKDGQLSFFRPERFGNEQLPLIAAASYCDFNYPVMHTNGGVVCVFTTQRLEQ